MKKIKKVLAFLKTLLYNKSCRYGERNTDN